MPTDHDEDEEDWANMTLESGNARDDRPGLGDNSGLEPDEVLEGMDLDDLLKEGRKMLLVDLVKAVNQGIATPAEKNTLRQMLKDNGMVMGDPTVGGTPSGQKDNTKPPLPTFERPDYYK